MLLLLPKKNKIEPAFCASLVDRVSTVDSSFLSSMLPWDQRGNRPAESAEAAAEAFGGVGAD